MPGLSLTAMLANSAVGAPLREKVFRNIWVGSLLSNMGTLIQSVGLAWLMMEMTHSADKVALVQTSMMLPVMFIALGAGALADMYDRRIVCLISMTISFLGAAAMTGLAMAHMISPFTLLALNFVIGCGNALMGPAWQASVSEQVPVDILPQAVALNSISFNIARSFGPAVGGVLVATLGAESSFAANALSYLPLMFVLYNWRRVREQARLPPEGFTRAIATGVRYLTFSPSIRQVMGRTLLTALAGAAVSALMPVMARNLLHGGALTYGVMLGAFGIGAVAGALNIAKLRSKMAAETIVKLAVFIFGVSTIIVGFSPWAVLTAPALFFGGACWMVSVTMFNVGIQLSAPRWVAGRALAAYQACIAGGVAAGSWGWGALADRIGVGPALVAAGAVMLFMPLLGYWLKMPVGQSNAPALNVLEDPDAKLAVTGRSGPIVVEVRYVVPQAKARDFHMVMQKLQLIRQRNGAYDWSIARDIGRPEVWTERYQFPTWHDYLRHRNRPTQAERDVQTEAITFHEGPEPPRVSRMLERPFGSVRWRDTVPDRSVDVLPATEA